MLKHHLLLTFRNLLRNKTSFFINLVGLSTGLACALLIFLWVNDELHVDKFHEKDARLLQVMESQQHTGNIRVIASTPGLLAEALAKEMPEVEYAATATPTYWFMGTTLSVDENNIKADGKYTGEDFFNMFSYNLLEGDASQVLSDKNSIVISVKLAMKLFGTTESVVGKAIEWQHSEQYRVSGIFEELPANSSDQFDFVLPLEVLTVMYPGLAMWENSGPDTFVLLQEGTNVGEFEDKIDDYLSTKTEDAEHRSLFVRKYSDAYLYGNYENGVQTGGRIEYVRLFSVISIFIVIIACINFMNLSTAKASKRMKEVGVKKTIGAGRGSLIAQHLGESLFFASLSMFLAILIVELFLPQFNIITGKQLVLSWNSSLILSLLSIAFITGLIAGSYPALYLSGFRPINVLKGKLKSSTGELWARKGLVVFQFAISVILIISVLVVHKQIAFVQSKNLGYSKENVLYFNIEGRIAENRDVFLSAIEDIPGISAASSIGERSVIGGGNTTNDLQWEGKDPETKIPFAARPVNYGLIEMLDMNIKSGRSFSKEFSSDSSKIIFNEAAIEAMGLENPVGKVIRLGDSDRQIIGVVENFHFESLHSNVDPLFFVLAPEHTLKIMARIEPGTEQETISRLENLFREFNPGFAFNYNFLDQQYQVQYQAEQRVALLSQYFAGIAILISCLGLFGLAAFTAERRLKEIGIRKVLGSSELGIVKILTGDFTRLVVISITIAMPVSYLVADRWLESFAYHIDLVWWYFACAGIVTLLITWFTVGMQTVKAAMVNPAKILRSE